MTHRNRTSRSSISPASRRLLVALVATAVPLTSLGCASMNNGEKGAAGGAAAGAILGGVIGNNTGGSTAKGAIIGAVVGGTAGALIGRRMDRQAEELESDLANASVERVGEGIQVTFDSGLLFDFDSSELRNEARANLADLAASLESYPETEVLVVGHTDSQGSDTYNQALSERRAESAKLYLVRQGIAPSRIEALGRGETEPVAGNDSEAGRQENRRVEVAIFASEEYQQRMLERHGGGGR